MKTLLLIALSLVSTLSLAAGTPYAQLSSSIGQTANANQQLVRMNQVDGINKIHFNPAVSDTDITIKKKGLYFVIAAPQTGIAYGHLNLWFILNGNGVDNSNVQLTQSGTNDVIISQGVLCLDKGDVLQMGFSGNVPLATYFPIGEPTIPSIIFTMYKAGNC
jgi:hypothetical protein